jgi:CrcB protein
VVVDYLLVAVGGAVGAPLRYLTDRFVSSRHDSLFPWGTFTVNVAGSFLLGLLAGAALVGAGTSTAGLLLGVGLGGALTTYSTLSYETARLFEQRARLFAVANIAGGILAGLAAVTVGYVIAAAVTGT